MRLFSPRALTVVWVMAASHTVFAAVTPVTNIVQINALGGTKQVDWRQLGSPGTQIPQPFQVSATGGYTFTVLKNNSTSPYVRADQGTGFLGDFLPGEALLYSTSLTAFDFRFQTPIQGIGGQLQIDKFGTWTPFVHAFTTDGADFTFQFAQDTNNQSADGSAPFVGVMASSPIISRVLFDSFFGGNTGINNVSLAVPEPGAVCFCVCTLIVSGCRVVRRRRMR